ncbi:MAG TPA: hypothetical protein VFG78_04430 [Gemmatimonadota bacterium]|nr:hypothetical protein [Gemmatimonadota bacterium]
MGVTGRRLALVLLVALIALMLGPQIPDRFGGNLWLWAAGYGAVALLLREVWREPGRIRAWWSGMGRGRRSALGAFAVLATLLGTLAMRTWAPGPFGKFSREQGLWEPLCLLLYWGSAIVIYRAIPDGGGRAGRRPWLGVAGVYAFLGFEEIDWFSIFGGLIGRIQGVYAGSLHDVIRLVSEGVLSPVGLAVVATILGLVAILLWRTGWIDPRLLGRLARSREFGWFVTGFAFLWIAASEEAHLFGWIARPPTPEEAIELVGALCLGLYALELAAERIPAS